MKRLQAWYERAMEASVEKAYQRAISEAAEAHLAKNQG